MSLKKDYTIIQCKRCSCDIEVWKYSLTRKVEHKRLCRACANKVRSEDIIAKTDRDTIYLLKQFRNIKNRCSGKYEGYESYTVKNIKVCEEWLDNPKKFVEWSKQNGWVKGLSIDRIDNSLGYSPDNCRWITIGKNVLESCKTRTVRGSSKYVGVCKRKDTGKWSVELRVNKKKINLGCYEDEYEAMMVRERYIIDNNIPYLKRNTD